MNDEEEEEEKENKERRSPELGDRWSAETIRNSYLQYQPYLYLYIGKWN